MNSLKSITIEKIRAACGETIFERALEYACTGLLRQRVLFPKIWQVRAEVAGNYGKSEKKLTLRQTQGRLFSKKVSFRFSCAADMHFCKHAAAIGVTWIHEPETFFNIESLPDMLAKKSKYRINGDHFTDGATILWLLNRVWHRRL